ncbi:MAG: tRNA-dihydrouridine synthase [Spirochaetia bacterium]
MVAARIPLGIWKDLQRGFSVLAPMEDVTDTVFRQIVREVGSPDLLMTEFTSTDGLCSGARAKGVGRLRFTGKERPLIAQIWGTKPDNFRRVAAEVREMGFDGVDINMGCPVRKIIKGGACGALIENPSLAGELIAAAREGAQDLPLSVKTRIGVTRPRAEEWLGFLLSQGLSALTIHGRTVAQQSEGEADWSAVALAVRLRDAAGLPTRIVGNGDVRTAEIFQERLAETGADGIMIGRGVFENLFLFRAIRGTGAEGPVDYARISPREKVLFFRRHLAFHRETWGERGNFNVLKKFAKTYVRAFGGARDLIDSVMHTRTYAEALSVLDAWLSPRDGDTLPVGSREESIIQ